MWLATLLWLWLLLQFYLYQARLPHSGHVDALSRAWRERFLRVGEQWEGLRLICQGAARVMDPGGEVSEASVASDADAGKVLLMLAWWGFSLGCLGFAAWWAWRQRQGRPLEESPPHGRDSVRRTELSLAWGGFLAWQVGGTLIALLLSVLRAGRPADGSGLLLQQVGVHLLAGVLAWRVLKGGRWSAPARQAWAWGLAGYGLAVAAVVVANLLVQGCLGRPPQSVNPLLRILGESAGLATALWFVDIVVVGPAIEEIWFRYILLDGLGSLFSTAAAVGLSALTFAVIHVDPHAILQLFSLGIVFGWVRCRAGRWEAAYFSHFLWNLSTFLLVCLA